MPVKVLIIRFSSFGDVVQALGALNSLRQLFPSGEFEILTRSEYAPLLTSQNQVHKVISFSRRDGFLGLLALAWRLRKVGYTHIYDAHNNLRSILTSVILQNFSTQRPLVLRRSKERWKQMLLFKFRKDRFERPQIAQKSYALPLKTWGLKDWVKQIYWSTPPLTTGVIEKFPTKKSVVLVPTTAHELKDWPLAHWLRLIDLMPQTSFLVLGGPADQNCTQLENHAPERVTNLAGQLSLLESCQQVANCLALVAADTGLLHVADASGVPAIGLYGPVMCCYPAFTTTQVLEVDLACRPCSRIGEGYCTHPELKKCLQDIRPEKVARVLTNILQNQTT